MSDVEHSDKVRDLFESENVAQVLVGKSDTEISNLLLEHVWAEMNMLTPAAAVVFEALERLKRQDAPMTGATMQIVDWPETDGPHTRGRAVVDGASAHLETCLEVERLLTNLQPHIEQACIPGHAVFLDNYVNQALMILRSVTDAAQAKR